MKLPGLIAACIVASYPTVALCQMISGNLWTLDNGGGRSNSSEQGPSMPRSVESQTIQNVQNIGTVTSYGLDQASPIESKIRDWGSRPVVQGYPFGSAYDPSNVPKARTLPSLSKGVSGAGNVMGILASPNDTAEHRIERGRNAAQLGMLVKNRPGAGVVEVIGDCAQAVVSLCRGNYVKSAEYLSSAIGKGVLGAVGAMEGGGLVGFDRGVEAATAAQAGLRFAADTLVGGSNGYTKEQSALLDANIPHQQTKMQNQRRQFEQLKQQRETQAASERAAPSYISSSSSDASSGLGILGAMLNGFSDAQQKARDAAQMNDSTSSYSKGNKIRLDCSGYRDARLTACEQENMRNGYGAGPTAAPSSRQASPQAPTGSSGFGATPSTTPSTFSGGQNTCRYPRSGKPGHNVECN